VIRVMDIVVSFVILHILGITAPYVGIMVMGMYISFVWCNDYEYCCFVC